MREISTIIYMYIHTRLNATIKMWHSYYDNYWSEKKITYSLGICSSDSKGLIAEARLSADTGECLPGMINSITKHKYTMEGFPLEPHSPIKLTATI
jgi:hypothetical protein